jgi:hypothetical protein
MGACHQDSLFSLMGAFLLQKLFLHYRTTHTEVYTSGFHCPSHKVGVNAWNVQTAAGEQLSLVSVMVRFMY